MYTTWSMLNCILDFQDQGYQLTLQVENHHGNQIIHLKDRSAVESLAVKSLQFLMRECNGEMRLSKFMDRFRRGFGFEVDLVSLKHNLYPAIQVRCVDHDPSATISIPSHPIISILLPTPLSPTPLSPTPLSPTPLSPTPLSPIYPSLAYLSLSRLSIPLSPIYPSLAYLSLNRSITSSCDF